MLNSVWAGDKIIQKKDINISIAVATEDALYVPVIKNADDKSIKGIAKEINELSQHVRNGTLKSEHIQGGTFTVNNTGSFGSVQSMGIINYPQAAILQVEAIVKRPVIIDNMIAIRDMVNLCLSIDHRILDGYVCGKFLNRVKIFSKKRIILKKQFINNSWKPCKSRLSFIFVLYWTRFLMYYKNYKNYNKRKKGEAV